MASFKLRGRKLWLIVGGAALLILALVLLTNKNSDSVEPPAIDNDGSVKISADSPARIKAIGASELDLGSTPTSLTADKIGYWNLVAYDPVSSKQQEVAIDHSTEQSLAVNFEFASESGLVGSDISDNGFCQSPPAG